MRSKTSSAAPVVRTHPVTGKQALFVNEGFTTRIVDVAEKESEALLSFLFAHITKPEFQVRWRWQENDLAIWDNRVTQHYANADYLPQRRIMQRATIPGISRFIVHNPSFSAHVGRGVAATRLLCSVHAGGAALTRPSNTTLRQMGLNIPLIAVRLQITQIHQHQPVDTVIERRIAAEIDKLHAARLA